MLKTRYAKNQEFGPVAGLRRQNVTNKLYVFLKSSDFGSVTVLRRQKVTKKFAFSLKVGILAP